MCFADVTARPAGEPGKGAGYRGIVAQTVGASAKDATYPGKGFGLPEHGPMAVAAMGRRFLALLADWLLCLLIVVGLTHPHYWVTVHGQKHLTSAYQTTQSWTLLLFAFEIYVMTAMAGITVGKRLLGIRVIRTNGARVGFGWAAVRTLLLLTVVPPLLTDRDLRGLHDRASDTVVVRF